MRTGRQGPLAVAGGALAMFWPGALAFGYTGVMGPYWRETFGVGQGATGSIMFFVLASLGIFMFLVGRWQERVGPRVMMAVGGGLCGLACLVLAFADSMGMVYAWGFLNGAASCFTYMPALTVVQRWFPQRRGLVSGIVNLVFGSSAALMVPLFNVMLDGLGYRGMNLLVAVAALVTGLVAAALASDPTRLPAAPGAAPPPPVAPSSTVGQALRSGSFWLIWLTWAAMGSAGIAMVVLSMGFGQSLGLSVQSAAVILTTFNLTNGLSRILTGYFSDRIRRTLTMGVAFAFAGAAYFLLPHVGSLGVAAFLAAVIGFAFGTLFAVSAPLAVDCFGLKHFGSIFGLIFTAYGFLSGLAGPSLSGFLLDSGGWSYTGVFFYLGALCLVAAVIISLVKPAPKVVPVVA